MASILGALADACDESLEPLEFLKCWETLAAPFEMPPPPLEIIHPPLELLGGY
jgi:hypothetical protein